MSGVTVPPGLVSTVLLCGLGWLLFGWLRSSRHDLAISGLICGLVLVQPAFWDFRISVGAALLAAAVSAVSFAALTFLQHQDVRRIALLGGSLAGAQLINPLWGAAATLMLPLALLRRLDGKKAAGLTGLYVSILFIPVLTATAIVILDERFRSGVWTLVRLHPAQAGVPAFVASLLPAAPLIAVLAARRWDASAVIIAVVAFTLLTTSMALDLFGVDSTFVSAAFAVLSLALIATSSSRPVGRPWALLLLSATLFASWSSAWLVSANA